MRAVVSRFAALALPLALAACNQTSAPQAEPAQTPAQMSHIGPAGFKLPEGSGCKGAVEKFRAQMKYDLDTGHTTKSVFETVNKEIDAAAGQCAAGQDGAAQAAIRASRARHGYPAG